MKTKYLILGAGPAGLSVANRLKQQGESSFVVVEKENEAGGLCRSINVDGSPFDIGGGHFLDVKREEVNHFLFNFMPMDEWNLFERDSRIRIHDTEIGHPFESNIWQMNIENQVEFLKSISKAGCNLGMDMPDSFVDWIYWKLGDKIASEYMIPYNRKIFTDNLNQLGTYWLEKLPNVSFEDTLRSCLERKPYGTQPGHAEFYYPKKYGYGELWLRMANELGNKKIHYNEEIVKLDCDNKRVYTKSGDCYEADFIIVTIPWTAFENIDGMPDDIVKSISELKYSSVETRYYEDTLDTDAQWIYFPNPELAYHRILVRSNFAKGSKGYWTETNSQRVNLLVESDKNTFRYMNEYAYPLNTIKKPVIMNRLLSWCSENSIIGLGRWGEWQHYNSDVTVEKSLRLVDSICK